jgi:hypothetical protein
LARIELDAAFHDFPKLSASAALQVALGRLNSRAFWAHEISRSTVYFGRDLTRPNLSEELFAQCPEWFSPSMAEIRMFLEATDGKRRQHAQHTAQVRMKVLCEKGKRAQTPYNCRMVICFSFGGLDLVTKREASRVRRCVSVNIGH